jgi:hypothetical protein
MKVFLRRGQVAKRYGTSTRSTYRMQEDGRLPPPDLYMGPYGLWAEESLEANERKATLRPPPSKTLTKAD